MLSDLEEKLRSIMTCTVSASGDRLLTVCWGGHAYTSSRVVVDDRVTVEPRDGVLVIRSSAGAWVQRKLRLYAVYRVVLGDEYREAGVVRVYTKHTDKDIYKEIS